MLRRTPGFTAVALLSLASRDGNGRPMFRLKLNLLLVEEWSKQLKSEKAKRAASGKAEVNSRGEPSPRLPKWRG